MIKLEICAGSLEDCIISDKNNIKRVELNSALYLGGLTPSLGTFLLAKEQTNLEIICMIRPRGAGFCYSESEIETMFLDAKLFLEEDVDGLAFGFLNEDKTINIELTKKMVNLIHSYGKIAVFHRAFDICDNPYKSIEQLIDLGVDRILTSGQKCRAIEGKKLIFDLIEKYQDKIEILPGCGINDQNVEELLENKKINQIHSSCKNYKKDNTTKNEVDYSYDQDSSYEFVDDKKIKLLLNKINESENND